MSGVRAIVLAGGKGTRLRPFTATVPKPLMPLGDVPILEILLRQLRDAGIDEVILACGYMGELIRAFFQDGSRLGLRLSYSIEEEPLGTAGPIAKALDRLAPKFLVLNGDLLTTLDFRRMLDEHERSGAAATIATHRREIAIDYGVVEIDDHGALSGYREKPHLSYEVSMGINALSARNVAPFLEPARRIDLPDLLLRLHVTGETVLCHRPNCVWFDIGRIDDYQRASEVFEARRGEFLAE